MASAQQLPVRCQPANGLVPDREAIEAVAQACPSADFRGKRVLVIVPDGTRTAPIGLIFKAIFSRIGSVTDKLDVLIALGTHPPMSEAAICRRLEISMEERLGVYGAVAFHNHAWDDPSALREIGAIPAKEISQLTNDLFAMEVPVEVNRLVFEYDQLVIVGPVFPHEVVGFSGGNKYLFPGVGGPRLLNFFHWLGAVVTNPMIIGNKWTPVRSIVDRAGAMVATPKLCFCLVVGRHGLAGLYAGAPEAAWEHASELSRRVHITHKDHAFDTILSCAAPMYDDLWTGGKAMYKLEPVLADGGELIIHAPHINQVSVSHGKTLLEVGYHCRDYFLKQWDRFEHYPWGVLAHSTHVYGLGTYENGLETPRARVVLATSIPPDTCRRINLGYRNPDVIRLQDFAAREEQGVLLVPKAGEMLYHLKHRPAWAGGVDRAQ
jgi:nickel-dependent lactate racemase